MSFAVHGLGTAVPPATVTQDEALLAARVLGGAGVRAATWLPAVYAHSGIRTRHPVLGRPLFDDIRRGTRESGSPFLPGETDAHPGPPTGERMRMYAEEAPKLALRAAAAALAESGFAPGSFTHLVTVSCTGFAAPGVDFALISDLGLSPTVERVNVGFMGCHGALNGLRVANAFCRADPAARVLLCAVELCSLHYHYGECPDRVVSNAIFADGAAALVGTGAGGGWRVAATGSCVIPGTADAMHWRVGDHGFEMGLSRRIPALIARHLRPWLEGWLRDNGVRLDEVRGWAIHPGGPKIVAAVEESLGLSAEAAAASRAVFAECGNMSSPTVLFVLDRLRKAGGGRPCVMLGFGPGLVAEAALWV
jgi:predicted naringenin-chalcone synthase